MTHRTTLGIVLLSLVCSAGCEDKKKETESSAGADSGLNEGPAVDPSLAKAMAAAGGKAKDGGVAFAGDGDGPPQSGVFAPGAADKQIKKGAPPKITLGSEGSEPRVLLGGVTPKAGQKTPLSVQLVLRTGPRSAFPPIDFSISLEAGKPKQEGSSEVPILAKVVGATVQPMSGVNAEATQAFAKLKGSEVSYGLMPNGAGQDFQFQLAKGADPGLDQEVRSLGELMATMTLPFPDKAVGNGAYWMASSREELAGIDSVVYRLVKVEAVDGDKVTLNVDTKRYAASDQIDMRGLPTEYGKLTLEQFQSVGKGNIVVEKGKPFPRSGQLQQTLVAQLVPEKAPDKRASMQTQITAEFSSGK